MVLVKDAGPDTGRTNGCRIRRRTLCMIRLAKVFRIAEAFIRTAGCMRCMVLSSETLFLGLCLRLCILVVG